MAQLKFYRKSTAPSSPVAGAIWFNTTNKTIQIYTDAGWETYTGNINDATWENNILTITKHDGTPVVLNFSDMASATVMGKMLTAVGLNTDGTFKKNATNYGGSATSIGGEISAIDTKLKSVSDLVGTTGVATQITNAKNELIGVSGDDKTADTIYGAKADATVKAAAAESNATRYTDNALKALAGSVSSTAGEKVVVSVEQANGKIDSVSVTLSDIASASELAGVKSTAEAAQTADEVSTAITNAINDLDATVKDEHDANVKISVTEADGKLTGVTVTTADIASAATLKTVKDQVDAFFAGASIDETVNLYKDTLLELQTYITEDAAAAVTMTESIAANKNNIVKLAGAKVNNKSIATTRLETDGSTAITVTEVTLNGGDIKLDNYSKGSSATASIATTDTINAALGKLEAKADKALTDASNAAAAGVTSLNGKTGAVTIATGTSNGSIKVGDADVAVQGLKSAAYTESTAYATAAQGAFADSSIQAVTFDSFITSENGKDKNGVIIFQVNAADAIPATDAAAKQKLATAYLVKSSIESALEWAEF